MNFNDALNRNLDEVERPPLMPAGVYEWLIYKVPPQDEIESPNGSWHTIDIPLKCLRATDDVDAESLAAYNGDVKGTLQTMRFMFDKNDSHKFDETLFRLKRFLEEHVGVEKGLSVKEGLNAAVNKRVLAQVIHKQDRTDPELFHANIGKTAPIG